MPSSLPKLGALRGANYNNKNKKTRIVVDKIAARFQPPQIVIKYTDLKHGSKKRVKFIDVPLDEFNKGQIGKHLLDLAIFIPFLVIYPWMLMCLVCFICLFVQMNRCFFLETLI